MPDFEALSEQFTSMLFEGTEMDEARLEAMVDELMESVSAEIDRLLDMDAWDEAFGALVQAVSLVNAAGSRKGRILKRVKNWIANVRGKLDAIAKKSTASSYSVAISVPWGITVTVNWSV